MQFLKTLKQAGSELIDEVKDSEIAKKAEEKLGSAKEAMSDAVDTVQEKVGITTTGYTIVYPNMENNGEPDTVIECDTIEDTIADIKSRTGIIIKEKA